MNATHARLRSCLSLAAFVLACSGCMPLDPAGSPPDAALDGTPDASAHDASMDATAKLDATLGTGEASTDASDSGDASIPLGCSTSERACRGTCISSNACCTADDCPTGASCEDDTCTCPTDQHVCDGRCVSSASSDSCGASCTPCQAPMGGTAPCVGGTCTPSCPSGQKACAGACIANNAACTGQCPSATHDCGGVCIDDVSVAGCGASSCTACPVPSHASATCNGTACDFSCDDTTKRCGSACIAKSACCTNADCQTNATCGGSGACACSAGFKACGNACIPNSACCSDTDCAAPSTCSAGACTCPNNERMCPSGQCLTVAVGCCDSSECGTGQQCVDSQCHFWCDLQTMPANVAAADYECIDFELGLPTMTALHWSNADTTNVKVDATRSLSTPNSVRAVGANGKLNWTPSVPPAGTANLSAITFAGQVMTDALPSALASNVSATLICLSMGYSNACLLYGNALALQKSSDPQASAYTGLLLRYNFWNPNNSAAPVNFDCPFRTPGGAPMAFQPGAWNGTTFAMSRTNSTVTLTLGGQTSTCTATLDSNVIASLNFGVASSFSWPVNYDNVVITMQR